jgi:endogenous inhibitor of DNA gyrase (YacG/DUF329 family)
MAGPERALLCPSCKKGVATEPGSRPASFPFCSDRCKLVDLGRWLGEEYRVAAPVTEQDEDAIATLGGERATARDREPRGEA